MRKSLSLSLSLCRDGIFFCLLTLMLLFGNNGRAQNLMPSVPTDPLL